MIHVCFPLYDKYGTYSKYLGTAICSLFVNAGDNPITAHIIHDSTLTEENKNKFQHLAQMFEKTILFHKIDTCEFQPLIKMVKGFTIGTLFRLKIPDIMSENIDKVIYLDCDLIVHLNITELWNMDLGDCYIAACSDPDEGLLKKQWLSKKKKTKNDHYFNAGIMVMNLKCIREMGNLCRMCLDFLIQHPECTLADQDAMNYFFCGNVYYLPSKFNYFSRKLCDVKTEPMEEGIYHISGESVNWEQNRNVERLFMHYLLLTEWGSGSEIHQYMQSWVSYESKKVLTLQSLMSRLMNENSPKIVIFGARSVLLSKLRKMITIQKMDYFIDNNKELWGRETNGIPIHSPEHIMKEPRGSFIVIVLSKRYYESIQQQLEKMGLVENKDFYDARLLLSEHDGEGYNENKMREYC